MSNMKLLMFVVASSTKGILLRDTPSKVIKARLPACPQLTLMYCVERGWISRPVVRSTIRSVNTNKLRCWFQQISYSGRYNITSRSFKMADLNDGESSFNKIRKISLFSLRVLRGLLLTYWEWYQIARMFCFCAPKTYPNKNFIDTWEIRTLACIAHGLSRAAP